MLKCIFAYYSMLDLFTDINSLGNPFVVKVTAKAAQDRVKVEHDSSGAVSLKVYVTTVPEKGRANKAILELLAKHLGVPKTSLSIIRGAQSNIKTIQYTK